MRALVVLVMIVGPVGLAWADTVPDVTGLTVQEATTLLKQAGFEVEVKRVYGPADLVTAQEPPGFSTRPAKTKVTLRVGAGKTSSTRDVPPATIAEKTVPTFVGIPANKARQEMKAWRGATLEESVVVPSLVGRVVHQWPAAGQPIPKGQHLIVVVGIAERPSDKHLDVPMLEGLSVEDARAAAGAAGFSLTVEEVDWGISGPPGLASPVFAQVPLPGSLAVKGTAVNVRVLKSAKTSIPLDDPPTATRNLPKPRLAAPIALLPAQHDVLRGPRVGFDWHPVKGASRYELSVQRETAQGWTPALTKTVEATGARDLPLPRGRFRWRVRALHEGVAGSWSAARYLYVYGERR